MLKQQLEDVTLTKNIMERQLQQFQGQQMREIAERRRAALDFYKQEFDRQHPGYKSAEIGRGYLMQAHEDGEGLDEVD